MKIAIDLDGVLFDTENWFRAYADIFNLDVEGGKVVNDKGLWVEDRFNWDKKTTSEYIRKCSEPVERKAPLMPFAREVLKALEKENELFVITSRGNYHKDEIETTTNRLKKEKLSFKKVLFKRDSKVEACRENGIELMIEDYPKNTKELAKNGIKCLYFRDLTDEHIKHKNVVEVRNWGEVAVELIKMGVLKKEDLVVEL